MNLSDLWFGTDVVNRTGRKNIRGDELAALIAASGLGASPFTGASVSARRAGAFSVPDGFGGYDLQFDAGTDFDDLGFFDAGQPTRLTIPDTDPAISRVLVIGNLVWSSSNNTNFQVQIRRTPVLNNESQQSVSAQGGTAVTQYLNTSLISNVSPGDYFEVRAYQFSFPSANKTLARGHLMLTVLK
jgi:hypothetical protein